MGNNKLGFLVGNKIIQIKISKYQIIFALEKFAEISVESDISIKTENIDIQYKQGDFSKITSILSLLEKNITDIFEDSDILNLKFEDQSEMTLGNANNGFESYSIIYNNKIFVK